MTTHTESDEHAPRNRKVIRILRQLFLLQLVWVASLAVLTFVLHIIWSTDWWYVRNETGQIVHGPIGRFSDDQIGVVAQVVPSTVIAIFVFAVGVAFVVAQVVPQARGTRAVEQLRDNRRLSLVISPAPPLVIGSAILVATSDSSALAGALLLLSVLYIMFALPLLISILIDATDPAEFQSLLFKDGKKLTGSTGSLIDKFQENRPGFRSKINIDPQPPMCPIDKPLAHSVEQRQIWKKIQRSTDSTYDLVRTLRGWVRVSATTGDSRELYEALEGTLGLASNYSREVMPFAHVSRSVPSIYWTHAHTTSERSPMHDAIMDEFFTARERDTNAPTLRESEFRQATKSWAPALMIRCPLDTSHSRHGITISQWAEQYRHLPATWFANETGRTIVRAVEFSLTGNGLLARDVARLLNTLQNTIVIFASGPEIESNSGQNNKGRWRARTAHNPAGYWSAGVGIHYLVEVGLGVKRCAIDQIEWFLDPFLRLIWLHERFRQLAEEQTNPKTSEQLRILAIGACAGALRVGEAIISTRCRASLGTIPAELQTLHEIVGVGLPHDPAVNLANGDDVKNAIWLASDEAGPLASTDRREIRHCDPTLAEKLLETLRQPRNRKVKSTVSSSNGSGAPNCAVFQPCSGP